MRRRAVVVMEQAAESVAAAHRPVADGCRESDRALLVEARVRAGVVVVRDVLGQHAPQVRLTGDEHLVQALPRQSRLAIIPNGIWQSYRTGWGNWATTWASVG